MEVIRIYIRYKRRAAPSVERHQASIDTSLAPLDTPQVTHHAETETAECRGKRKKKKKSKRTKGSSHLTLVPQSLSDGVIEYRVHSKGFSQIFAKVQEFFIYEMIEKRKAFMKAFMGSVMKLSYWILGIVLEHVSNLIWTESGLQR